MTGPEFQCQAVTDTVVVMVSLSISREIPSAILFVAQLSTNGACRTDSAHRPARTNTVKISVVFRLIRPLPSRVSVFRILLALLDRALEHNDFRGGPRNWWHGTRTPYACLLKHILCGCLALKAKEVRVIRRTISNEGLGGFQCSRLQLASVRSA